MLRFASIAAVTVSAPAVIGMGGNAGMRAMEGDFGM